MSIIASPRLVLRPVLPEDSDALFDLTTTNQAHLRRWLPWLTAERTRDSTAAFVRECIELETHGKSLLRLLIWDDRLVGLISFNHIDRDNRSGSLGYWLSADQQGQGIVTQACRALIQFGFERLGLHRVSIAAASDNLRSRAIATRLGFREEGRLRDAEWLYDRFVDHAVYGLLRTEWEPPSASL